MYKILTQEEMSKTHSTALDLLENVGMAIHNERALNLLKDAGVKVDLKKDMAWPRASLIEEGIRRAPKTFVLGGRSVQNDMKMEKGKTYFRTPTGYTFVIDFETGIHRESNKADLEEFARLTDALDQIDCAATIIHPQDVKEETRDLYAIKMFMEKTQKHIVTQILHPRSLPYLDEMIRLTVPDDRERRRRPPLSLVISPVSPLQYMEITAELLMGCAKRGIPILLTSAVFPGATGPMTLAGTLVMLHAEMLMGILITQLTEPGIPIVYQGRTPMLDMRAGACLYGAIETGMANLAIVQMAHHIGLPVDVRVGTDSKVSDGQACIEKAFNMAIPLFLSDPNWICGAGAFGVDATVSMEQLVIDAEMIAAARRVIRGIEITDETLAKEVITKVGPGGSFLGERHTREYFRKEFFLPSILDQNSRRVWEMQGRKDIVVRAKEKVTRILKEYQPVPLDNDVRDGLRQVLDKAEKELCKPS